MFSLDDTLEVAEWPSAGVVLKGFSHIEDSFVWQIGRFGEITFDIQEAGKPRSQGVDVILDMDVFKTGPEGLEGQNVFVYLNGLRIGSTFISGRRVVILHVPTSVLRARGNVLTLDTPDAAKPSSYGMGDERVLGVQLFSLQFRRDV